MEQQEFNSQDASDALKKCAGVYLIMEVRGGRALLERRGKPAKPLEDELGQAAPQDTIDILVTSRPTQPAMVSITNSATELMEESGDDLESDANDPSTECVKDLVGPTWRWRPVH